MPGELKWIVRDWDGDQLAEGTRHVTIPAGKPLICEVPAPVFPDHLRFAEAEFSLEIPGQVIPKVHAYWLAPHRPHDDVALHPESPFGMGVYLNRFGGTDQEVVARANGITIYAIVAYFPAWSKGYTSEGIDQYAAFLRQLVKRYKDRIKQWEIWNEPKIFFWQGPKELYAECLIKSYHAIKETDPTAEVLGISRRRH